MQKIESKLSQWVEDYLFHPNYLQVVISIVLLPLSLIYYFIIKSKRAFTKKIDFQIPIISIGNIVIGGSGKTPFAIELANRYPDSTIILRGYGRKSKGLQIVSLNGDIKCSVDISGDEAMLIAMKCKDSSVIVSENRDKGIEFAKSQGVKLIILDDGFTKYHIKKFEILLEPNIKLKNSFLLPSGAYREMISSYRYADLILKEEIDYKRIVSIENPTSKMILLTAIANPKRLDRFLPKGIIKKVYLSDHSYFELELLNELLSECDSLLVTEKDYVKLKDFNIPLSILNLKLDIKDEILYKISSMLESYKI